MRRPRKINVSKPQTDLTPGALKLIQSLRKTQLYIQVTAENLLIAAELVSKGYGYAQTSYAFEDERGIEIALYPKALDLK
jgi:hypothetical protein